jgi:hypothetical protein
MRLTVNLDGRGPAEKTGVLEVAKFRLLGDPVISEVLQVKEEDTPGGTPGRRTRVLTEQRQALDFDRMQAPFSVGYGQFVLEDAELRGPLLGASLRGKADFNAQSVNLGGTYVPLQGLNSALGVIPGLGQLLTGPRGEGVLGITFAVKGPMARPDVIVNPLSLLGPGAFRDLFQIADPPMQVTPRAPPKPTVLPGQGPKASSQPVTAERRLAPTAPPEVGGAWTSTTTRGDPPVQEPVPPAAKKPAARPAEKKAPTPVTPTP